MVEIFGLKEMNRLQYWSNSCGELHYHGKYDLNDECELPSELQRVYSDIWTDSGNFLTYLAELDGKYGIALIAEYDDEYSKYYNLSMNEVAKKLMIGMDKMEFPHTKLILGIETGFNGCHEAIAFIDSIVSQDDFSEIDYNFCVSLNDIFGDLSKVIRINYNKC